MYSADADDQLAGQVTIEDYAQKIVWSRLMV